MAPVLVTLILPYYVEHTSVVLRQYHTTRRGKAAVLANTLDSTSKQPP